MRMESGPVAPLSPPTKAGRHLFPSGKRGNYESPSSNSLRTSRPRNLPPGHPQPILFAKIRRILQESKHPVPSSPIRPALEKAGRRLHHPNLLRHSSRNPLIQRNTVFLSQPPRRILSRIGKSERISMRAGCFSKSVAYNYLQLWQNVKRRSRSILTCPRSTGNWLSRSSKVVQKRTLSAT